MKLVPIDGANAMLLEQLVRALPKKVRRYTLQTCPTCGVPSFDLGQHLCGRPGVW
jgi:hypothetical protein